MSLLLLLLLLLQYFLNSLSHSNLYFEPCFKTNKLTKKQRKLKNDKNSSNLEQLGDNQHLEEYTKLELEKFIFDSYGEKLRIVSTMFATRYLENGY